MKKSKGIVTLILTALIMVALGYVAIWGIGTEKAGAASGIKQGLDLAGGVSITYQVAGEEKPSAEDMSDTIYKLQRRVETYSPDRCRRKSELFLYWRRIHRLFTEQDNR